MADGLNPFLDDDDTFQNDLDDCPPGPPKRQSTPENDDVTLDNIALRLIKDNLVLTALELHTELTESGRELPRLRDYFSNPGNFERTKPESSPPGLQRTSSCQTFDSLDFARYSDDGDKADDKVAVLEFELRKAQDTIKSLRAQLTRAAETELSSPEGTTSSDDNVTKGEQIKPHEKRALNFLVNEYMLMNNYKLTSVTFAEENENQDFEDWDDVGLNIAKPPDILHLYRDYGQHVIPSVDREEVGCGVNLDQEQMEAKEKEFNDIREELEYRVSELDDHIKSLTKENETLAKQIKLLELKSTLPRASTPTASPVNTPKKEHVTDNMIGQTIEDSQNDNSLTNEIEDSKLDQTDNIQSELGNQGLNSELTNHIEDSLQVEVGSQNHTMNVAEMSSRNLDISNQNVNTDKVQEQEKTFSWEHTDRKMSQSFQKALMELAFQVAQDNRIVCEVSKITDSSSENIVSMLARCLPHIVPNVLLAKREELIPLILCTASLHSDAKERDKLLNILFNLIKRPDQEQRQMILTGCVVFAQHVGPTRVEVELLPQCWEQISHKYPERRLLVAEACGALAPYLPNEIRSSLVLSMLQMMLHDDKAEEVREATVKSLGLLMGFIDDPDKYTQSSELLFHALKDSCDNVVTAAQQVFLPAFGTWSYELGKLETDLLHNLLKQIEQVVRPRSSSDPQNHSVPIDDKKCISLIDTVQVLIPLLFKSVLDTGPFVDKLDGSEQEGHLEVTRFPKAVSPLMDIFVITGDNNHLAALVSAFEEYISAEWFDPWENYEWVADDFIPRFVAILNSIEVTIPKLVHNLSKFFFNFCRTFGRTFVTLKVKPRFQAVLTVSEESLDIGVVSGDTALTKSTVPVYASGVLMTFNQEEDRQELTTFLQDLLCTLSLCHASLDSLQAAFREICINPTYHELLLTVLWDGVVHTSAQVRSTTAHMFEMLIKGVSETLVATRVVPALVTLASDPEISVRISTVAAFGVVVESITQREILDKVHMQFQTFMDDPMYRDQHTLHVELIRTFARVGPNAEPKFRDEFVLPRLTIMAANNNHVTNETRKRDIAMQLFEAYSALSCCFISEQLISEAMLPGLRCLRQDVAQVAHDLEPVVLSLIKDFETKVDTTRPAERSGSFTNATAVTIATADNVKNKMLNTFKDIKDKSSTSRVANIFRKK